MRDLLAFPACHGRLEWGDPEAACAACGRVYPVEDGVPVFLDAADDYKLRQAAYFDDEADDEWEIERPAGAPELYRWLLAEKFRRSVAGLDGVVRGATALAVCGGSGMEAEFLARAGARVVTADISLGAARRARERARRHGFDVLSIVADVERLPFADRSVDLVYVHDGLHHVERPLAGLAEMARVARRAVSVNEPAAAAATRLAVRLGLAQDVEEAGNRVERLAPDAVAGVLRAAGFDVVRADRYAMYYRHEPGKAARLLSRPPALALAKAGFRGANAVLSRVGNKLTVQAVRSVS